VFDGEQRCTTPGMFMQSWTRGASSMTLRHIQILDDDPTAAMVTQRGLQVLLQTEADVNVRVATSPDEVLQTCLSEPIDLVIIDPDPRNGIASRLISSVRRYRPGIQVLILTAHDTPRLRTQMRDLGVHSYLAKPIELTELSRVVRELLNYVQA
jgi:DNA-binding NarL/FixJ family response regulator